ncbi:hypothetical protein NAP1_15638 [Erythrobacter sp. NAP1]|uniref:hypothetical protein n=1 Tax=Erythrobacter sp. NAP1 TaxID=237727 RepID=UPI0000687578|nr:hypothetical protein [Erythrobacter sp. NAP1]EAQ29045.1 hypothetical protein NAP1_15638 [Erythrobacter sp. NAP1]
MGVFQKSRFNPKPGILDFWNEFRKPNPYRWPILVMSSLPIAALMYYLIQDRNYVTPERPQITYITTLEEGRSDEEIIASNLENQEIKNLREAAEEDLEARKRDIYKALGAAAGMDVDEIDRRGRAARAAEEAERRAELDALMGRASEGESGESDEGPASEAPGESPAS